MKPCFKGRPLIPITIFHLSNLLKNASSGISAQLMLIVQTLINFFIPSGSGQAVATMPIMAQLADIIGVTRQTAVLAFQFPFRNNRALNLL